MRNFLKSKTLNKRKIRVSGAMIAKFLKNIQEISLSLENKVIILLVSLLRLRKNQDH